MFSTCYKPKKVSSDSYNMKIYHFQLSQKLLVSPAFSTALANKMNTALCLSSVVHFLVESLCMN